MKINLIEYNGCFSFGLTPETLEEASMIIRLKMNAKKEVRGIFATAHKGGIITGDLVIAKIKNARADVK